MSGMGSGSGVPGGVMGGIGTAPTPVVKIAPPKGPTRVSSGVVSGLKISGANPVYPPIARAAHVSGAVVLHAIISKTGTISNLTVISGPEMLRAAAVDAVQNWRYKPYLLNGDPTEVDTQITVNFNFGGG
jgi:protein TonB